MMMMNTMFMMKMMIMNTMMSTNTYEIVRHIIVSPSPPPPCYFGLSFPAGGTCNRISGGGLSATPPLPSGPPPPEAVSLSSSRTFQSSPSPEALLSSNGGETCPTSMPLDHATPYLVQGISKVPFANLTNNFHLLQDCYRDSLRLFL